MSMVSTGSSTENKEAVLSTGTSKAENEEGSWPLKLRKTLDELKSYHIGTYASSGVFEVPSLTPAITVKGFGDIGLPFNASQAEGLKPYATKSSFGKGTETLQDTSIRDAWEIGAQDVAISGKGWDSLLSTVLNLALSQLGIADATKSGVEPHLYKLLVYEEGGHFKPHQDIVKEEGMFGTLILQMPSQFSGGSATLAHNDETISVDLAEDSNRLFKYMAFYGDTVHEIHPLTSGVRLTLAYNLVSTTPAKMQHSVNLEKQALVAAQMQKLEQVLQEWPESESGNEILIKLDDHAYAPYNLTFDKLYGRDMIMVQSLRCASSESGAPLLNVTLDCREYQRTEQEGGSHEEYQNATGLHPLDPKHCKWPAPRGDGFYKLVKESDAGNKLALFGYKPYGEESEPYNGNDGGWKCQMYGAVFAAISRHDGNQEAEEPQAFKFPKLK